MEKRDFKVGDLVRCIDKGHTNLVVGKVYTITEINSLYIYVGRMGGYFPRRFELIDISKRNLSFE